MLDGVISVTPGYAGGSMPNPSYEEVCSGATGHAEAVRIEYDPSKISFRSLLAVFFATHDPTTLNRQGDDIGTQYRSAIFYADEEERKEAEAYIAELEASSGSGAPIVTALEPRGAFYEAEPEHRRYFESHPEKAYCRIVISPKIEKARREFAELMKR